VHGKAGAGASDAVARLQIGDSFSGRDDRSELLYPGVCG